MAYAESNGQVTDKSKGQTRDPNALRTLGFLCIIGSNTS